MCHYAGIANNMVVQDVCGRIVVEYGWLWGIRVFVFSLPTREVDQGRQNAEHGVFVGWAAAVVWNYAQTWPALFGSL